MPDIRACSLLQSRRPRAGQNKGRGHLSTCRCAAKAGARNSFLFSSHRPIQAEALTALPEVDAERTKVHRGSHQGSTNPSQGPYQTMPGFALTAPWSARADAIVCPDRAKVRMGCRQGPSKTPPRFVRHDAKVCTDCSEVRRRSCRGSFNSSFPHVIASSIRATCCKCMFFHPLPAHPIRSASSGLFTPSAPIPFATWV